MGKESKIFLSGVYIFLIVLSLYIVWITLPPCVKADFKNEHNLTVKSETRIVNGSTTIEYTIDNDAIKIPYKKIHFEKPEYKDVEKIEDLNAVIHIGNWNVWVRKEKIKPQQWAVCMEIGSIYLGEGKPSDKAEVVFYSGDVPIGYSTVGVRVEKR